MNSISRNSNLKYNKDDAKTKKVNANFKSIANVKMNRGLNF